MKDEYIRGAVAIVIFSICAYLVLAGFNGELRAFMGFIVGYYFGRGIPSIETRLKKHE